MKRKGNFRFGDATGAGKLIVKRGSKAKYRFFNTGKSVIKLFLDGKATSGSADYTLAKKRSIDLRCKEIVIVGTGIEGIYEEVHSEARTGRIRKKNQTETVIASTKKNNPYRIFNTSESDFLTRATNSLEVGFRGSHFHELPAKQSMDVVAAESGGKCDIKVKAAANSHRITGIYEDLLRASDARSGRFWHPLAGSSQGEITIADGVASAKDLIYRVSNPGENSIQLQFSDMDPTSPTITMSELVEEGCSVDVQLPAGHALQAKPQNTGDDLMGVYEFLGLE